MASRLSLGGYLVLRLAPGHRRHQEKTETLQDREILGDADVERPEERKA